MTKAVLAAAVLGMIGCAGGALAETITGVAPVYGRILAYPMPADFLPQYENVNGNRYIVEHVATDETVENWTQMLTITGTKDLGPGDITPMDYAMQVGSGFMAACPDSFGAWDVGNANIAGAEQSRLVVFACGTLQGPAGPFSETAMILVTQSDVDTYTFQWAERGAAISSVPTFDAARWSGPQQMLMGFRMCERVEGETMPFPSCSQIGL